MFDAKTLQQKTLWKLAQEIFFFHAGRSPRLVKSVQYALQNSLLQPITSNVLKRTVFPHFCGGENAESSIKIASLLYHQHNITTILDLSSEDTLNEEQMQLNTLDKIRLLRQLGNWFPSIDHNPVRFFPLKCTSVLSYHVLESIAALLLRNPHLLLSITSYQQLLPLLSPQEQKQWSDGYHRILDICNEALYQQKIGLLLDAEQSRRQPAVELLYRLLAIRYNTFSSISQSLSPAPSNSNTHHDSRQPIIFNTYQCYLCRSSEALFRDYEFSRHYELVFGVKLVRGAYMKTEALLSSTTQDAQDALQSYPIYATKLQTDENYNQLLDYLFQQMASPSHSQATTATSTIQLILATHNRESILRAIQLMERYQISKESSAVHFAQILGMTDNLTLGLANAGYQVSKLILFGQFMELMPWLIRRLEENQDSLGGLHQEVDVLHQAFLNKLLRK